MAGAAAATPMPVSVYLALRITPRDDGELIQAATVAGGVLAVPVCPGEVLGDVDGRVRPDVAGLDQPRDRAAFSGLTCAR